MKDFIFVPMEKGEPTKESPIEFMRLDELKYYKIVCEIQSQYIKGEISKEELDSKCEIARLEYISFLNQKNLQIQKEIESQKRMTIMMEEMWKK